MKKTTLFSFLREAIANSFRSLRQFFGPRLTRPASSRNARLSTSVATPSLWVLCGLLFAPHTARAQGPLTPPGPPGPTMKTLEQIEPRVSISSLPFTITSSGSYYLTTNLTGAPGLNGILIQADNVTLDLNGFALVGVPGSSNGISAPSLRSNLVVRNGSIRNWGAHGADLSTAFNCHLSHLRVSHCASRGLNIGPIGLVEDCSAQANGEAGIFLGDGAAARDCLSSQNAGIGISGESGNNISNCSAQGNQQHGIRTRSVSLIEHCLARLNAGDGISVGPNSLIQNCISQSNQGQGLLAEDASTAASSMAANNTGIGILAGINAKVSNCQALANGQDGIRVGNSSSISDSAASNNQGRGVNAGAASTVVSCSAAGNTGGGIWVESAGKVIDCSALANAQSGIRAGKGSTVNRCTSQGNSGDGIQVTEECRVTENNCHDNFSVVFSSGIRVTGAKNHVENNTVTSNDRGISFDASGSVVLRNAASNNSVNFVNATNQLLGPIITNQTELNNSPHPWANFSY